MTRAPIFRIARLFTALCLSLALSPSWAIAQSPGHGRTVDPWLPTLDDPAGDLTRVVNNTRSVVLGDRVHASRVFALPPTLGWVVPQSFRGTDYLRNCEEMQTLQATSRALSEQIAKLLIGESAFETTLEALRSERVALLEERELTLEYQAIDDQADTVEEASWDLEDEIYELQRRCAGGCTAPLRAQLHGMTAQLGRMRAEITALRDEASALRRRNAAAVSRLRQVETELARVQAAAEEEIARVTALRDELWNLYSRYAVLHAGTATFRLDSSWAQSVRTLAADNPYFSVVAAPTHDAKVQAGLVPGIGSDSYLASLPSVLAYRVGSGAWNEESLALASFPETLTLEVKLSMNGACPIYRTERFDVETANGLPIFGVTISYEHDVAYGHEVQASYNGYEVLQAIRGGGSGRDLLLVPSAIEAARSRVSVRFTTPPASASQRKLIEDQLVSEAIDRVLKQVGSLQYDWDGFDRFRPWLHRRGAALPAPRVSGSLRAITETTKYDAILRASNVKPSEPNDPSPVPRKPSPPSSGTSLMQARVVQNALTVYETALLPSPGFDQLRLDGTTWTLSPRFQEALLRQALNRTFTIGHLRFSTSRRPAISTFDELSTPVTGQFTSVTGCTVPWGASTCVGSVHYMSNVTSTCIYEGTTLHGCHPSRLSLTLTPGQHRLTLRSERSPTATALAARVVTIEAEPECTSNSQCSDGLWCNGQELCRAGVCVSGARPCLRMCSEAGDQCINPGCPTGRCPQLP